MTSFLSGQLISGLAFLPAARLAHDSSDWRYYIGPLQFRLIPRHPSLTAATLIRDNHCRHRERPRLLRAL